MEVTDPTGTLFAQVQDGIDLTGDLFKYYISDMKNVKIAKNDFQKCKAGINTKNFLVTQQ